MRAPRGRGRISCIRQRVGRPFRPPSRFATLSQTPAPLACSSESHNVNLFNEMTLPICPGASPCRCNSRRPGSVPTAVTTLQSRFQKPPGALGEAWHESCSIVEQHPDSAPKSRIFAPRNQAGNCYESLLAEGATDMRRKRPDSTSSKPKTEDKLHYHLYSGDGLVFGCDIGHDIPAEVGKQGVRTALAWAIDHCPRIRAAVDAGRRRN